jgi:hypothetical protein
MLRQTSPLGIRSYSSSLYVKDTPLVGLSDLAHVRRVTDSNIGSMLKKYRERDVAADYIERYPIKANAIQVDGTFHMKMTVDIPEQEIMYIATLAEILKDGWIKFLSLVVLFWPLLERIKRFAFANHFLPSTSSKTMQ